MLRVIDNKVYQSVNVQNSVEVAAFFHNLQKLVTEAQSNQQSSHYDIDLAQISVRLSFFDNKLSAILLPALSHITHPSAASQNPEYQIYVLDATAIRSPFPALEGIANKFIFRGDIEDFSSPQYQIAYLIHPKMICAIDHFNKVGIVIAQDAKRIPAFTTASPFKEIFNWIMLKNQCSLIHAAAVGNQDGAVLLTGKSGAGKSMTAIRCLFHGFDFYGDDIVGISNKNKPAVHAIFASAKVFQKDIAEITGLEKYSKWSNLKPADKEVFFLSEDYKEQLPIQAPIKAILHLVKSDGKAAISPASIANVVNVVGSTTCAIFPYFHQKHTLQLISLFKNVACFNFELGNQVADIPPLLKHFLTYMATT